MNRLFSALRLRAEYFRAGRGLYRKRDFATGVGEISVVGPFARPFDITVDAQGYVYVTEFAADRIMRLTGNLAFDGWFGGASGGWQAGRPCTYRRADRNAFRRPHATCFDAAGGFCVADLDNRRIRRFAPHGDEIDPIGDGLIEGPAGVRVIANGDVLVCDAVSGAVILFGADGTVRRRVPGFNQPHSALVMADGAWLVTDTWNHRIVRVSPDDTRSIFVGGPGTAEGQLNAPVTLSPDGEGGVVVAEFGNHRIHRFDAAGNSLGCFGAAARPGRAPGAFRHPYGVSVHGDDIYVADTENNRIQVIHRAL